MNHKTIKLEEGKNNGSEKREWADINMIRMVTASSVVAKGTTLYILKGVIVPMMRGRKEDILMKGRRKQKNNGWIRN